MKKVLLVAYDYPPSKNVGKVRPSKFVRFLPKFGWQPIVLAVNDPTAPEDLPPNGNVEVYRVKEWPHPLKAYYRFREQRAKAKGLGDEFATKMSAPHAASPSSSGQGIIGLKLWVLSFMRIPDEEIGWILPAIFKGVGLIRRQRITHLITTGPPFTSQVIGLGLKWLTGVHWVADFRDPWSLNFKYNSAGNRITDAVEARLIRQVMKSADIVISVTPQMTEQLKKEYSYLNPDKFVTLTNGFDPSDFVGLPQRRTSSEPWIFSYLGEFNFGRTPEPFLMALKSLINEGAIQSTEIKVRFIGNVAFAEGQSVKKMVHRLGLQSIVTVESVVPRHEALQLALESHVLLVLSEKHSTTVPFKLFEALGAGATILNIGCGGAVADVLAKTGRGVAVEHTNVVEIRNGILECTRRSRSEKSRRTAEPWANPAIQAYNFEKLTGRLAMLLDGIDLPKSSVNDEQRTR